MPTFAILNNNLVVNIIVAESQEIAEIVTGAKCIEYNETNPAQIGGTYDEANNIFVLPPTPALEG